MKAQAIAAVTIISYHFIAGDRILETDCRDFDHYSALPEAITFQGRVYGKTGWSSDTRRACYKASAKLAFPSANG